MTKNNSEFFPTTEDVEEAYERSTRTRYEQLKNQRALLSSVGEPEDLVPFAWRFPLKAGDGKNVNKTLRKLLKD
jgi:hypothetical protein